MHASPAKTRRCSASHGEVNICLFYGISDEHVSSTECDLSVRAWTTNLEDSDMLGKLASGGLMHITKNA